VQDVKAISAHRTVAAVRVMSAVVWAAACAVVVRIVAEEHGYPSTWVATANVWVALLTLPALIAVGAQRTAVERTKWFFWLGLVLPPSQSAALMFSLGWA
jgi:hypothetical protein